MVTFHPEEIFRESLEANATLRFQHLANADTNADADISLEEVAQIPAPVVELTKEDARDAGVLDGGYIVDDMSKFPGWARFIGQRLLQRAFYMDGNVCRDDVSRSKAFEAESPYEL